MKEPARSSMGCLVKGLIGLAVCAVVFIVGAAIAGYYLFFHTALPVRALVAMLNQDPNVQIEGVTGSLSSGFEVQKVRIKDDAGHTNSLDEIRLMYRTEGETFIITDIHVRRGHLYIDRSQYTATGRASAGDPASRRKDAVDGGSNARFVIEKVSINDITVEDVGSGETFHLEKIELDRLDVGKDFSMGKLVVKSTDCHVEILPRDGAGTGNAFAIHGLFQPGLHANLIAPLDVKGAVDASDPENVRVDLSAFGGKLGIRSGDKALALRIQGFAPADYFREAPPLRDIDLEIARHETSGRARGSFSIGGKRFVVDQELAGSKADAKADLTATHKAGAATYTIRLPIRGDSERLFPPMQLATDPALPLNEAVAGLLHGKTHDALTDEEKKQVGTALEYFTAPGP